MKWLVVFLLLAAPAWADDDGAFGSPFRFTEGGGAAIYAHVCAGCHMANGGGAAGAGAYPSLVADPNLAAAAYPVGVVLHGKRAMPAFARLLTNRQIAEVVGYIRTHFGNAYPPQAGGVELGRSTKP